MFVYAYIFGNLASLVDDLTPKFQQEFEANYKKALAYVKSSKLESFVNKVHVTFLSDNFLPSNRTTIHTSGKIAKALMKTLS